MNSRFVAIVCCACLWLSGCAGLHKPEPDDLSWQQHREALQQLEHWTASGKVALRSPEQAESAGMVWQQRGGATSIRLSGPVGIGATTLDSDGEYLEIRQGDEYSRWRLDDALLPQSGRHWQLPLQALPYWIRGIPAPALPLQEVTLDANGRLPLSIQQLDWTVDYESFGEFEGHTLPTRLRVYREDTSARIILRQWRGFTSP